MTLLASFLRCALVTRTGELVGYVTLPSIEPMPDVVVVGCWRVFHRELQQPEAMLEREPKYVEAAVWHAPLIVAPPASTAPPASPCTGETLG